MNWLLFYGFSLIAPPLWGLRGYLMAVRMGWPHRHAEREGYRVFGLSAMFHSAAVVIAAALQIGGIL